MILRVSLCPDLEIDAFATAFAVGGLVTVRSNPYTAATPGGMGLPRRRLVELPVRRIRLRGFVPRFHYRLHHRFHHSVLLGVAPCVQRINSRPHFKEVARWRLLLTLRRRRWGHLFFLTGWPTSGSTTRFHRAVDSHVQRVGQRWAAHPAVELGRFAKDYNWGVASRRRRGARAAAAAALAESLFVRPRWCAPPGGVATAHPGLIRRDWLRLPDRPTMGRPPACPTTRDERLVGRLARFARRQRYTRVYRWRASRLARHTRWFFRKMARATPAPRKRHLRLARRRSRRRMGGPPRPGRYFRRITRSSLPKAHVHRLALLETNHLVAAPPAGSLTYTEVTHAGWATRLASSISNMLEYTYFVDLPRELTLQRRRQRGRRLKVRDHPKWGPFFAQLYRLKRDWLATGVVQAVVHRNRIDPKNRAPIYNDTNHPERHPIQGGPWSWLYWSTTQWGRGSYWRTKPVNRAKRVFVESVASGFVHEAEARTWYSGGAGTSLIRAGTFSEGDYLGDYPTIEINGGIRLRLFKTAPPSVVAPLEPLVAPVAPPVVAPTLRFRPTLAASTVRPTLWSLVAGWPAHRWRHRRHLYLAHNRPYLAQWRGRPSRWSFRDWVRWGRWNLAGVWSEVVDTGVNTLATAWWLAKLPFRATWWLAKLPFRATWWLAKRTFRRGRNIVLFVQNVRGLVDEIFFDTLRAYLTQKRMFRRFRWAYLAWTHAYASDNFADETLNPEVDVELGNWTEGEDEEPAVDYGEELESEGTYWNAINPEEWDGHWNPDFEDYFDESRDVFGDLLFEEAPYYVRLLFTPMVDALVRLPVWGLLEGLSIAVVWVKREWQIWWAGFLLRHPSRAVKWAAVVGRRAIHLGVWLVVYGWGVNLVSPDELNLFVTYSCGMTFYEEYYVAWTALAFGTTVWLIGPHPFREYLFREIGPENIGFVVLAGLVLTTPEEYYPQRPLSDPQRLYLDRTLGYWSSKPLRRFPTQHHYGGGHGSTYPIFGYDDIRQTVANFNDIQDWPEIDFTDKDPTVGITPDRPENEWNQPGYPLTDESGENFFWDRNPVHYRNNYMVRIKRDQFYENDAFEPYFRDDLDDSFRNESMYHRVNTRGHSGHLVTYPPVANRSYQAVTPLDP